MTPDCDTENHDEAVSYALDNAEKFAALGALAVRIVHDLRNPLSTIHSAAEMLICSDLGGSQLQRLARNMYQASLRSQDLLQHFADLCRWKSGRRERCNLRHVVFACLRRISAAAEVRSIAIAHDIANDVALVVDRARIECVLDNLFVNAVEAMPDGGAIHLSAVVVENSVLIEVRDTGPGIAPEIRERLFQPFVTAGKTRGLGLGLAASREAIVEHGGQMWLRDAPGFGACFAIRLPVEFES